MPINPNIALGAQQPQPINMLGQMGQMYALKGAKQEFEGNEALRDFYASGGDLSKAEDRQRLMSMAPMQGQKLIGQQSEISARDVKTQADSLKIIKDNVSLANNPQAMAEYLKGAYSTPGGVLLARLVPLDKALAAIPTDPKAFAEYQRNLGLTADKLYNSADSLLSAQVSREGHGVQMRGQNMTDARVREQLEFDRTKRNVIAMEGGYGQTDPYGNIYRVEGYGALRGPNAAPAGSVGGGGAPALPPAAANAFVTARPSVNNLVTQPTAQPQGAGPTVANAAAITAQQNVPRPPARPEVAPTLTRVEDPANPGQMLEIDARTYKGGTVGAPGVLGVARTSKLTPAQELKLKTEMGKEFESVGRVVQQTNELLESIDAVRNSNLESVTGQFDARTPSFGKEAQIAETRFNNLKGKVTAIAKANASIGGAIGSIANQEWQILANQIAVLERTGGKTANLEQIDQLERQALSIVNRMRDGFERRYGENLNDLAPQYKELPNVNYTPGQYTPTGKKSSGVDNSNPWLK